MQRAAQPHLTMCQLPNAGAQASTACAQHVLTPSVVVPCHAHGARAWHPALGGRAVAATRTRDIHVRIAAPDKEDTQGSPEPELPALEQPGPVAGAFCRC